jgi:pimeloyl-ACP methyl ester carboxylesterase
MVEKIVFSNAETAVSIEQNQKEFGGYKKALSLLRSLLCIIPTHWILQKLSQRFFKTLKMESPEQTEQVIRLVQDECRVATRTECANILSDMIDSIDHALLFYPQAYEKKVDQILIIDSKDDKAIPKNIKAAMYRLCPGAKTYHFETGGHTPMFTRAEEYKKILLGFLLS